MEQVEKEKDLKQKKEVLEELDTEVEAMMIQEGEAMIVKDNTASRDLTQDTSDQGQGPSHTETVETHSHSPTLSELIIVTNSR